MSNDLLLDTFDSLLRTCAVPGTQPGHSPERPPAAVFALKGWPPGDAAVIVPDFGPFPFLVEDEINGLLYKPNSVEYLREKLFYVKEPIIRKKLSLGASKRAHTFHETDLSYGEAVKRCINECKK